MSSSRRPPLPRHLILFDHTGGLKTNVSPFFTGANYSPNALNVEYAVSLGSVSKAKQYAQHSSNAGSTSIQGIFPFESADETNRLFMASNGTIYEDVTGTWTSRKTGLSATASFDYAMFYDKIYVSNGTDSVYYSSNGTTWTAVAITPKFCETYKNRMYYANYGGSNANRFTYSDLGDGTFSGGVALTSPSIGNFVDEITGRITGLHAAFNSLYIFTDKTFHAWDESYLVKVDNVGCTSNRSIASGNGRLFFANKQGVWMSTGGKARFTSRPVQYWWDGISASNYSLLNSAFWNNEYYLWIGNSNGQSNVVLVFNTLYNTWRVLTGWPSAAMAVWNNTNSEENLYFGSNTTSSLVYKSQNVYTQATVAASSVYDYDVQFPAGPEKEFFGLNLHCYAESFGNPVFQISYALESETVFHELTSWMLEGKGYMEQKEISLPSSCRGRAIQIRITESSGTNAWNWHGVKLYFYSDKGIDD